MTETLFGESASEAGPEAPRASKRKAHSGASEREDHRPHDGWLDVLTDYIKDHPTVAAAIAFQIGAAAGVLTKSAGAAIGRSRAPARVRAGVSPSVARLRGAVAPALAEIAALFARGEPPKRYARKATRRRGASRPRRKKASARRRRAA